MARNGDKRQPQELNKFAVPDPFDSAVAYMCDPNEEIVHGCRVVVAFDEGDGRTRWFTARVLTKHPQKSKRVRIRVECEGGGRSDLWSSPEHLTRVVSKSIFEPF